MTMTEQAPPMLATSFRDAMSCLVSGLAALTAQRADGRPCGMLVSSICSYSVSPPSVLVAVDQASRSYTTLISCSWFGVHLLGRAQHRSAQVLAGGADDKFENLEWAWDRAIPRLRRVPVYLRCRSTAVLYHGDHAILIGEAAEVAQHEGEPLVWFQRRFDWQLDTCDPNS